MVAPNPSFRFRSLQPNRAQSQRQLAERLRHYFEEHPQISREEFLLDAIEKEMDSRLVERQVLRRVNVPSELDDSIPTASHRRPLTAEDLRVSRTACRAAGAPSSPAIGLVGPSTAILSPRVVITSVRMVAATLRFGQEEQVFLNLHQSAQRRRMQELTHGTETCR